MIDETKEVQAAKDRINITMSSIAEETASLTGTDWEKKLPQIRKERQILKELGFVQVQDKNKSETKPMMEDNQKNMEEMNQSN